MTELCELPELTACDEEPIHIPGSIQPHGFVMALTEPDLDIIWQSANAPQMLNQPANLKQARRLIELVGPSVMPYLVSTTREKGRGALNPYRLHTALGAHVDVVWHRHDNYLIIEGEPATSTESANSALFDQVTDAITRARNAADTDELCRIVAEQVRRMLGYQRVMVYRFDRDWHGEVVAESRTGSIFGSFLGHHFPASDIPAQARALYAINLIRAIPDVRYRPVPLVRVGGTAADDHPLDLSHTGLRSVSPVHVEYLENMNVRASFSLSLIVEGRLWGLIACHHSTPRLVPHSIRVYSVLFAELAAFKLAELLARDRASRVIGFDFEIDRFGAAIQAHGSVAAALKVEGPALIASFGCDGMVIRLGQDGEHRIGSVPPDPWPGRVAERLASISGGEVMATEHLARIDPAFAAFAEQASGALYIALAAPGEFILMIRKEVQRSITWAGRPQEKAGVLPDRLRIHPRKSFETWREEVNNRSLPWGEEALNAVRLLRRLILQTIAGALR